MIARVWRGWAQPEQALAYERHFTTAVQAELRAVAGFVGAQLLRRQVGDEVELVAITTWESLAVIHGFAGEDTERAVVAPEAQRLLSRYEERVTHFEVVLATGSPGDESRG
jgi:heme-degrading monooxygenase HmoA